jgi:hypothetical protein
MCLFSGLCVQAQSEPMQVPGSYEQEVQNEDPLNLLSPSVGRVLGNEANPALGIILDFGWAWFSSEARYRQGGHALNTNGPGIMGAELSASAAIDPYFEFEMAFELSHLHLEEIVATTTALPGNLQVRAGKYLADIGRHNPTHIHAWHFVSQPLANEWLFGAEGMSLPGVEVSWLAPLPWYVEFIAGVQMGEAGSFRTSFAGDPGFSDFIYPMRLAQFFDFNNDHAGQLGLNTVLGTSVSAPEKNNRVYAYGVDLLYRYRPFGAGRSGYSHITTVVEGWFRQMEVAGSLLEDIGGYADLIFGISRYWEIALRGELWRRRGGANESDEWNRDRFGMNMGRMNTAISLSPTHFSRIRLQHAYEVVGAHGPSHMVVMALEVSAGAHGAHAY